MESVRVWDVGTGKEMFKLLFPDEDVCSIACGKSLLAVGLYDGGVRIWDVSGKEPKELAPLKTATRKGIQAHSVSLSEDETKLVVANKGNETFLIWDLKTRTQLHKVTERNSLSVMSGAISRDGKFAAYGGWDDKVTVLDVKTKKELVALDAGHYVNSVAISGDGKWLAAAHWDGTVVIWDLNTLEHFGTLVHRKNQLLTVAFSADGKTVAAAGDGGKIKVWTLKRVD